MKIDTTKYQTGWTCEAEGTPEAIAALATEYGWIMEDAADYGYEEETDVLVFAIPCSQMEGHDPTDEKSIEGHGAWIGTISI